MRPTLTPRAALAILIAGCAAPTPTGSLDPPALNAIEITPDSATVDAEDSLSFQAVGRMSDGSTSVVTLEWSATGGTVDGRGVYHAGPTTGTYSVIASTTDRRRADTAKVKVKPRAALSSVTVAPGLDTLSPGATRTFSVSGQYSDGSTRTVNVTWSATGGSITSAGVYTAGAAQGTFRVIATTTGGGAVADTATVVIRTPTLTLTSLDVTPALDTLLLGANRTFSAMGHYSDGSSGNVSVTWSATGGGITQAGLYTAGSTQGTFRVIGLATAASKADTATVVIKAAAPTLAAVVVTPATATLDPAGTQAFAAAGQYSDGSTGPVAVTWTATGGTITPGGQYTAGATAGSYRVIATATTAALADTSAVTIRDLTTPPPSGTVLLTEAFDDNGAGARGWYANTSPPISTVEHHSGAGSLEEHWTQGATLPVNGASLRHLFTATERLYVRYWVKYSANFVGSGRLYHPHEFTFLTDVDDMWLGPSRTHLTTYIETNWQNGGIPLLAATDALNIDVNNVGTDLTNVTEQRATSGCNGNSDGYTTGCYQFGGEWYNSKEWHATGPVFTDTPGPAYKNDWHRVEVYYQMNTVTNGKGQYNGVAQYWFDGQLMIDRHNILFRTGAHPTMKFNQILVAFYIGDGSPADQTVWIDDLVVATGPVP